VKVWCKRALQKCKFDAAYIKTYTSCPWKPLKNHVLCAPKITVCYSKNVMFFFSENNFKKCLKKQRFHPKNKQTLCGIDSTSLCEWIWWQEGPKSLQNNCITVYVSGNICRGRSKWLINCGLDCVLRKVDLKKKNPLVIDGFWAGRPFSCLYINE
jgi:hypothetical protein